MPLQWSTIDQLERRAVVISKAFQFDGNCLSTPECNNYTKAPIILIHGFTAGDSVGGGQGQDSTWGSFGAELTKPRKDEPNPRGGHPVFELRWKTHMRFEEAAAKLAEYVDVVQRITKRKPILVAHSFGGIVASTYVAGLAERQEGDSWKTVSSRGDDGKSKVLMVVTLGSPLSGIADNAFITDTTKLTYGRDPQEYTINMCKSLTCWQAGATDVNGSLFQRLYKSLNVNINAGSIIKKLSNSWTSDKVQNAIDIPYYLLVGIKSPIDHVFETVGGSVYPKEYDAWNGGKSFQWEKLGDGLIGLMGQAAIPEDFAKSPYTNSNALGQIGSYDIANKLGGDFVDRLIKSRPDEMMSPYVIANRSYYFAPYAAHTTAHATDIKAHATYAEAHLPESRKVPFCADNQPPYLLNLKEETCPQVDHPLRHFIDGIFDTTENQTVASPNLKPKTLAIDLSTKSNPVVTKSVSSKAISENVWNTSITIIKKNVGFMRLYMVKTDSNGHLTFDFGSAIGLIESNPDLSQYVLDVVVGDGVRGRQISQRVDGLEKEGDINLTIQLDPVNAPLISTSGFVFDSDNKTQPIANAKVYLSLGINQDSSLVTKITTSNTSRVVTTDATGKFSLANISAGSYTVVVEKAGYKTKSMSNVEVGNGATITLYSGDAVVVPQPTINVSSISPVQAVLNQKTTFTLTGTGFVTGMAYAIADCDSVESISTTATQLKFACTPKGAIGVKTLTLKDKPAGKVVYTGQVTVVNQTTPVPTISVNNISPVQAVLNQKTTFTLTGTGFVAGMAYTIADCDNFESVSSSATQLTFACIPKGTTGVKALTLKDKPAGTVLYTGQVTVVNQPTPVPTISVSSISPAQAVLNQKTTFTLTGTGFVSGMAYTIADCDGVESISTTATELKFACTPKGTIGVKTLTVKDKPAGTVIYTGQVTVVTTTTRVATIQAASTTPTINTESSFSLVNTVFDGIKSIVWKFGQEIVEVFDNFGNAIKHIFNTLGEATVSATLKDQTGKEVATATTKVVVTALVCPEGQIVQGGKCVNPQPPVISTDLLNDTGITNCANDNTIFDDCSAASLGGWFGLNQDGEVGRDYLAANGQLAKVGAGDAGFDFTKISATGQTLPANATEWSCVKDNHTGLMWEVKTDDGGLRDKDNAYQWYDPNPSTNGGFEGYVNDGNNTQAFTQAVNAQSLCGYTDWRLPKRQELQSIVNYGKYGAVIDSAYFPNIRTYNGLFWSSSPVASDSNSAWVVSPEGGGSYGSYKNADYFYFALLVRSSR